MARTHTLDKYKVPRICFVNKLDRTGADFFRCVDMIRDRLGAKPLPIQVPIGIESSLTGVVDLVKMKAQVWKNEALGAEWEYKDIPEDLKEISQKYRTELVETAVEQDEKLMESYLIGEEIKEEDLIKSTTPFNEASIPTGIWTTKGFAPNLSFIISTHLKKSAPVLSNLFTKQILGTLYLSACLQTVSD